MPLRNTTREPRADEAVYCNRLVDTGCVEGVSLTAGTADINIAFDRARVADTRRCEEVDSIEHDVIGKKRFKPKPRRDGVFVIKIEAWVTNNRNRYIEIAKFVERSGGRTGGRVELVRFKNGTPVTR